MPGPNDQDSAREFRLSRSPYVSPVLLLLEEEDGYQPSPYPACATCPASTWYHTSQTLECFCSVLHRLTWGEDVKPVMICDAREPEIKGLLQRIADDKRAGG